MTCRSFPPQEFLRFRTSTWDEFGNKDAAGPCDLPTDTVSLGLGHHNQLGAKFHSVHSQQSRT